MRYFRTGGFLFGAVYTLWRGYLRLIKELATWFYRRTLHACGRNTVFGTSVYISDPKRVRIGSSCYIGSGVSLSCEHDSGYLSIGDGVQINDGCKIDFTGGVTIEDNALLSNSVAIYSHDHGHDPRSRPVPNALVIERNVWIGAHAIVLPGTERIGQRAIIGAGAVVTRPVAEGAIVAGNPARLIKMRKD